jgi:hypothetical protein
MNLHRFGLESGDFGVTTPRTTSEYALSRFAVHIYSDTMVHLNTMIAHFGLAALPDADPGQGGMLKQGILLACILLGLTIVIMIVLQLGVIRRRIRRRRESQVRPAPPHPLERHESDPWVESARRMDDKAIRKHEDG